MTSNTVRLIILLKQIKWLINNINLDIMLYSLNSYYHQCTTKISRPIGLSASSDEWKLDSLTKPVSGMHSLAIEKNWKNERKSFNAQD